MSRLKASTAFAVPCPPGFVGWAKAVLTPETFDVIKCDKVSCFQVLGAYVYALRNAGTEGTNWEHIPEEFLAAFQRRKPGGTVLVPKHPSND